jgi:competence protein ComEA
MSKGFWKDYFSFSKKERIGVLILISIIVVFVILPYFFSPDFKKPVVDHRLQGELTALQNGSAIKDTEGHDEPLSTIADTTSKDTKTKFHLFYFDPNTLDEGGWEKLGISDKAIHTIINYRNKGGYFKQPEDIRKIYGLKKEEADAVIPYIKITSKDKQEGVIEKTIVENKTQKYSIGKININTATAEDFKTLPGISDVLGNRIVKFRNAMHGFKSVEDIKRTYGLPDSTYNNILPYLTMNDSSTEKN